MGVTVTFIAILELMKEGLIEIVQAQAYAPIHLRTAATARHLSVVAGGAADADAENQAALAQPAHPDENDAEQDEPDETPSPGLSAMDDSVTAAQDESDTPDPEASK